MTIKNKLNLYYKLIRFHQPTGFFLLMWPCLIGLAMAGRGSLDFKLALIFIIGSFLMRSAGCIINDLADIKFDKKVERTKTRPIASGKISKKEAMIVLFLFLALSCLLLLFLNKYAVIISLSSILLVIMYPFCKRFTYLPQLFLGFTFNIGVLVAWAASRGNLSLPAIYLYIALIFWTLGYDTIYAFQDIKDDLKIGVKSTAILFNYKAPKYIKWFYTLTAILFVFSASLSAMPLYFYPLASIPLAILFWQAKTLNIEDKNNCAIRFKANSIVGAAMFLAIFLSRMI